MVIVAVVPDPLAVAMANVPPSGAAARAVGDHDGGARGDGVVGAAGERSGPPIPGRLWRRSSRSVPPVIAPRR